jgi:hypothetical protein
MTVGISMNILDQIEKIFPRCMAIIKGKADHDYLRPIHQHPSKMEPNTLLLVFVFCYLPVIVWIATMFPSGSSGKEDLKEEGYLFIARTRPRRRRIRR